MILLHIALIFAEPELSDYQAHPHIKAPVAI